MTLLRKNLNNSPLALKLKAVRNDLLKLHKTLLEHEKANYEAYNGQIANTGVYLRLVLDDPHFAWLRILSGLIVEIDEAFDSDEPVSDEIVFVFADQIREMLMTGESENEFARKYTVALENSHQAVVQHSGIADQLAEIKR
ncbi:MAG: hypothetical protein M3209_00755 [Acidobacteriota bacterium]|nr:hypothetical protein [Acidobacteriota bacterium]